MSNPTMNDFKQKLGSIFAFCEENGILEVVINAGELHRSLGGYPGYNHRMPVCCKAMEGMREDGDIVISKPRKGEGASLSIRFLLPRGGKTDYISKRKPSSISRKSRVIKETAFETQPKTPREAYRVPVLSALVGFGGSGSLEQVKERVSKKMAGVLSDYDFEQLPHSHRLRWENEVEWTRFELVNEGLMADDSKRGLWEITQIGRDWLESQ